MSAPAGKERRRAFAEGNCPMITSIRTEGALETWTGFGGRIL